MDINLNKLAGYSIFTADMRLLTDAPVATAAIALRWLDDDDSRKVLAVEDDGTEDGAGVPVTRRDLEQLAQKGC